MSSKSFSELAASEKWLFAGQVTIALGSMFISIGTLLKIATDGSLDNLERATSQPRDVKQPEWFTYT